MKGDGCEWSPKEDKTIIIWRRSNMKPILPEVIKPFYTKKVGDFAHLHEQS